MNSTLQELITQSVELMFIGMGAVFCILALLITVISLVSRLLQRYAPEQPAEFPVRSARATAPVRGDDDEEQTIAVIAAALRAYRRKQP